MRTYDQRGKLSIFGPQHTLAYASFAPDGATAFVSESHGFSAITRNNTGSFSLTLKDRPVTQPVYWTEQMWQENNVYHFVNVTGYATGTLDLEHRRSTAALLTGSVPALSDTVGQLQLHVLYRTGL